jgi:hypothetical protein
MRQNGALADAPALAVSDSGRIASGVTSSMAEPLL